MSGVQKQSNIGTILLSIFIPSFILLSSALLSFSIWFIYSQRESISENPQRILVTAEDMKHWLKNFSPNSKYANFEEKNQDDGTYLLEYEYKNPNKPNSLYIYHQIKVKNKVFVYPNTDTKNNIIFDEIKSRLNEKVEFVQRNDLFHWGESSQFGLIKNNGKTIGNYFLMEKGEVQFYLVVTGIHFENKHFLEKVLQPKLDSINEFFFRNKKNDEIEFEIIQEV